MHEVVTDSGLAAEYDVVYEGVDRTVDLLFRTLGDEHCDQAFAKGIDICRKVVESYDTEFAFRVLPEPGNDEIEA